MSSCGQFVFEIGHFIACVFCIKTAHTQNIPILMRVRIKKILLVQTPVTPRLFPVNSVSAFFNVILVKITSLKVDL